MIFSQVAYGLMLFPVNRFCQFVTAIRLFNRSITLKNFQQFQLSSDCILIFIDGDR